MWKRRKHLICLTIIILQFWLIATVDGRVDICSSLCRCVNESHYVKIHCDFKENKEYILDDGLSLHKLSSSLNITLGKNSRLTFKTGFFETDNRINSVVVQGSHDDFKKSDSRVSLKRHAIQGIGGNFPEICFRNLKSVDLSEKSLDGPIELNLIAEQVWELTAGKELFGKTTFNASFSEIADLNLSDGVLSTSNFKLTKPKMFINKSTIDKLHPLRATKLTELRIENTEIRSIEPEAFRILELQSLILDSVKIGKIEKNIFRDGNALDNLAVTNCDIDKIATKAIHDVGITKFTFEKNIINSIEENSMDFIAGSLTIAHNRINLLGANWLKSENWNKVNVFNNTFGSFESFSLENPTPGDGFECNIERNSFTKPQFGSFKSINEKCQIKDLSFKENCSCAFGTWLAKLFGENKSSKHQSQSYCSIDPKDTLFSCFDAGTVKYDQYYAEICKGKKPLKCGKIKIDKIDAKFIDPKVLSDDFDWHDYMHYIIGGAIAIILIPCLCITILLRRKSRSSENDTYSRPTMHHQTDLLQLNQSEGPPSYEASLRSTKTFSNHDHIIIKRTLETMKLKQPEGKYEIVYNNTKRLLHEHLNEYEKVRIIGDIVQTIGECENSGEDFVAFTDILYKHLAPDTTTTVRTTTVPRPQAPVIDDVYAEPVLPQNIRDPAKTNSEHIYAEPTVLMQQQTMIPLLLATNYSHPLDNNVNINNNNLYSEPVIHEANVVGSTFKPKVATPYAISDTINQQPSTSKNLPDILDRMEPGPSGEINRITRSPTTNRKIPEYTVPSTSHKTPVRVTQDTIEDWSDESMENSQSSNHSGGSNATMKIEELIEYADNET